MKELINTASSSLRFAYVAIPKGLGGVGQLAINLLILRSLGPESAGMLFVCLTLMILIDAVLGAAVDTAVIRITTSRGETGTPDSEEVQKSALVGKLVATCLGLAPVIAWREPLSQILFQTKIQGDLLMMTVVGLGGLQLFRSIQTYYQLNGQFARYGIVDASHSLIRFGGVGVLIWANSATPFRILACYAAGSLVVGGLFLHESAVPLLRARFSFHRLRELFTYVKWYLCAAAVGSLTSRMDMLLLSAQQGSRAAGIFSAAQAMVIVFQVLGAYMGIVFAPKVMPLLNKGRLAGIYWRFQAVVVVLCVVIFVSFPHALDHLGWLLPPSYYEARPVVVTLLPSALMSMANFPWTITLLLFFHPRLMFFLELLALPILFFLYRSEIAAHGAWGAAWVTSGYALAKTAVLQLLAWRTMRDFSVPVCQLAPTT
jgi:O-antigen/teichoic acid export membrane protein